MEHYTKMAVADGPHTWPVEKFAIYIDQQWRVCHNVNLIMKIQGEQCFVFADKLVVETLNLMNVSKTFIKKDVFVIVHEKMGMFHKIKIKFANILHVPEIIKKLQFFCVVQDVESVSQNTPDPNFMDFKQALKEEMHRQTGETNTLKDTFPDDFPFEDFLKTCIMDPNFTNIVDNVEKVLESYIH